MKTLKSILILTVMLCGVHQSFAQGKVTQDTIMVEGVCDQCKSRIEEAAFGKGVKHVSWDKQTKQLAIAYRNDKVELHEIEERIAKAGHNTENVKTERVDYEGLPACCRYEHVHTH